MNRILILALGIFLIVSFTPSAFATWSGVTSLGTTKVVGEPSCSPIASEEVVCVGRSSQHNLIADRYVNGKWLGWTNIAGTVASDPSCTNDGDGDIICGVMSTADTLEATLFNGSIWGAFVDSKQAGYSDTYQKSEAPSCTLLSTKTVLCAVRSQTGTLLAATFSGTVWKILASGGNNLTTAPSCAGDSMNHVICSSQAIFSGANNAFMNRFDGTKWDGILTFNPAFITPIAPYCAGMGAGNFEGHVVCTVHGLDSLIYALEFDGGAWPSSNFTAFGQITGFVMSRTSCAITTPGSVTCGWIDASGSLLYANSLVAGSWVGYAAAGGPTLIAGPACAPLTEGKVLCLVVGLNNQALSIVGP